MFTASTKTKQGRQIHAFRVAVFSGLALSIALPCLHASDEGFSVRFTAKKALFSGEVDSDETAQTLAKAVKLARPDIEIVNEGMHINAMTEMPPVIDLKSVLVEIALSTHEGRFSINDKTIVVSGLTDSTVTSTALMIRLRPIEGGRQIISHICVVPTEDLPDIPVFLADGKTAETLIDLDPRQTPEDLFEIPGILPQKLSSLILYFSKQTSPGNKPALTAIPATPVGKLRAVPIVMIQGGNPGADLVASPLPSIPTGPTYEEMSPVLFSRNTILLQANQESVLEQSVKLLQEVRLSGKRIILRAMKPQAGSATFNDWLCQRRAETAKTMLAERGINAAVITTETVNSKKTGDTGEVRLFVLIPPPPVPEQAPPPLDSLSEPGQPVVENKPGSNPDTE